MKLLLRSTVIPLPGIPFLGCITRIHKNWLNLNRPNWCSNALKPCKRPYGTAARRNIKKLFTHQQSCDKSLYIYPLDYL